MVDEPPIEGYDILHHMDTLTPLLIVDDDAFNREGLRAYLATKGYAISEAGEAASALAITRQTPIAVASSISRFRLRPPSG